MNNSEINIINVNAIKEMINWEFKFLNISFDYNF